MTDVEGAPPVWPSIIRSATLKQTISTTKVLCIGAGGIGCELLKTLVCTGFQHIEVVDLDTIETSNLNRQFLFRKHHVGLSKARTAADVVRIFQPTATITAHHANVKEAQFDIDFFRRFDLVLNGLDNLEARRHVNRLCLAAERPLIESGTAGYLGQVTVHLKGQTQCFECDAKAAPKSFPICTLRNTPDRPIHCIVWAKDLLFARLFGKPEAASDLDEAPAVGAAAEADGAAASTSSAVPPAADGPNPFVRLPDEASADFAARVFEHVFCTDIERLIGVEDLWKKRAPPKALRLAEVLAGAAEPAGGTPAGPGSASRALGLTNPNEKWSVRDNARVFLHGIVSYFEARSGEVGGAVFDKDDDSAVDFVTAAANLRSLNYDIPTQSLFDAKGMAGNIIHAIATTNAIIAGLIVVEALKIVAGMRALCRDHFLSEEPSRRRAGDSGRLLSALQPEPPRANCMVCGRAQVVLRADTATMTLQALISQVLKRRLSITSPQLMCGAFIYEEGEGLEDDEVAANQAMLPTALASLPGGGLRHGSILNVQDQSQHFTVDVIIEHQAEFDEEKEPDGWVLSGPIPVARPEDAAAVAAAAAAAASTEPSTSAGAAGADDADDFTMLDDGPEDGGAQLAATAAAAAGGSAGEAAGKKRAREDDEEAQAAEAARKGKGKAVAAAAPVAVAAGADDDDDVVVILD